MFTWFISQIKESVLVFKFLECLKQRKTKQGVRDLSYFWLNTCEDLFSTKELMAYFPCISSWAFHKERYCAWVVLFGHWLDVDICGGTFCIFCRDLKARWGPEGIQHILYVLVCRSSEGKQAFRSWKTSIGAHQSVRSRYFNMWKGN